MRSLVWRWSLAILIGSLWHLVMPAPSGAASSAPAARWWVASR